MYDTIHCQKALKALSLVRLGKLEEGVTTCDEVLATKPTDEHVLGAMSHVLRSLSRRSSLPLARLLLLTLLLDDEMAVMFEAAYKKFPQNDEYGAQAFMANVRLGNWKAAQQVSPSEVCPVLLMYHVTRCHYFSVGYEASQKLKGRSIYLLEYHVHNTASAFRDRDAFVTSDSVFLLGYRTGYNTGNSGSTLQTRVTFSG